MLPCSAAGLKPPVVLLVDDEEVVRSALRDMLELLGFHVCEAASGEASIEQVEQGHLQPDLIISDFMMRNMDGIQTLEVLGQLCPGIRRILCSGTPEAECFQGRTLANCAYLGKPFRFQELEAVVRP